MQSLLLEMRCELESAASRSAFHLEPISKAITKLMVKMEQNISSLGCRINFRKHQGGIFIFLRTTDHLHFSKFVNLQNVKMLK